MTHVNLDLLARPSGGFAMVAMDQRESLRAMFCDAGFPRPEVTDERLIEFKLDVAHVLRPHASAFLIDREYGFEDVRATSSGGGLILAADDLIQEPGGPVADTYLDTVATNMDLSGVAAIKLLVIWRRDDQRERRVEMARDFIAAAASRGVLSVLEPVVRATEAELSAGTWNTEEAIREAARELSELRPSLYKVQVPLQGKADQAVLIEECRKLNEAIVTPWVVLSQGVPLELFPGAVTAACMAGASGFLAGRAVWSDLVGRTDLPAALAEVSVPRLENLARIVDEHATSWSDR